MNFVTQPALTFDWELPGTQWERQKREKDQKADEIESLFSDILRDGNAFLDPYTARKINPDWPKATEDKIYVEKLRIRIYTAMQKYPNETMRYKSLLDELDIRAINFLANYLKSEYERMPEVSGAPPASNISWRARVPSNPLK